MPGPFTTATAGRRHEESRLARLNGTERLPELLIPFEEDKGFGLRIVCPGSCGRSAYVIPRGWAAGLIGVHLNREAGVCDASDLPTDVKSAIDRDDQLNPEEAAVRTWVWRQESACKGVDDTGEPCWHSERAACRQRHATPRKRRAAK